MAPILERLVAIETKVDGIEDKLSTVEKDIKDVKEKKIINIEKFLIQSSTYVQTVTQLNSGQPASPPLYNSNSPLTINDEGRKALKDTYFEESINNNLDFLFKLIDGIGVKSALDVEILSMAIIRYAITDKDVVIFKKTEDFLYTHPEFNNNEVIKTAGLHLRDKYLEEHPELDPTKNIEDVE